MKKILIVEDNAANIKLFSRILSALNYEVVVAMNGIEGVEQAGLEKPDLILMDIQMPDMNGVEAMKKIKELPGMAHIPIVALTGYAMSGDRERFLSEGFAGYLAKPVEVDGLLAAVSRYI